MQDPANCAFASVYGSLTAFARIPHHAPPLRGQTALRRRSEVGLTAQAAASCGNTDPLSNPALNILHQIVDPRVTNFAEVYFLGNIERSDLASELAERIRLSLRFNPTCEMPANCAFASVYGSLTAFARIPHHAPPLRGQTGLRRRSEVGLTPQAAASRGNTDSLSNPALNILHQIVDPRVTNFAGVYFLGNIERSDLASELAERTPSQPAFQSDMRDARRLCAHERLWSPSWHLLEYRTTRHRCADKRAI